MATTIKLKNGSGAPLAGDLVAGEPALDLTNKRLYTEDSGGTVIEVGTNPGTDVTFADNRKAIFGAGSDLEIYHNATDSVIADVGTGNLKILANDLRINNADSSKSYITGVNGSYVNLYYNGSQKLVTTNTGIDVTGSVVSDGLTVDTTTLVVDAGNNRVGIGTASPAQQLHLSGTGAIKQRYTRSANSTDISLASNGMFNTDNLAATGFGWYNNGSEAMRIDSSGNVGIGTTSPSGTFHSKVGSGGSGTLGQAVFGYLGGSTHYLDANTIIFRNGSEAESMRINSSGNVGIGTSSPTSQSGFGTPVLEVRGSSGGSLLSTNSTTGLEAVFTAFPTGVNISAAGAATASTGNNIVFRTGSTNSDYNSAERMRIDSSGNVGIGTTNPQKPLHVKLATNENVTIQTGGGGDTRISAINDAFSATTQFSVQGDPLIFRTLGGGEAARFDSSYNLLVGKTSATLSASGMMVISGNSLTLTIASGTTYHLHDGSNYKFYVNANGGIYNYQNNDVNLSDQRVKKDIVDSGNYLEKLCNIPVRNFRYNEDAEDGKHHLGVIAQEVEAVAPEFVNKESWEHTDGPMDTVYNTDLMFAMMKSIQELSAQVNELKAEVAALKGA